MFWLLFQNERLFYPHFPQFTKPLLLMPALTDNIFAGIVNKHLILKIAASTVTPKNVLPNYYNWARRNISLITNVLFGWGNSPSVVVSQKQELAVWRPAPLLCITAQVTARYRHKTGNYSRRGESFSIYKLQPVLHFQRAGMWHLAKTKPFLTTPLAPVFFSRTCYSFHDYFYSHEDNSFNKTLANRIMVFIF